MECCVRFEPNLISCGLAVRCLEPCVPVCMCRAKQPKPVCVCGTLCTQRRMVCKEVEVAGSAHFVPITSPRAHSTVGHAGEAYAAGVYNKYCSVGGYRYFIILPCPSARFALHTDRDRGATKAEIRGKSNKL